ncbi:AbrB/MazE/SpoVT family DNA-binding domain-containing protein [Candidatus Woesearchaeota archaeon]|nr:AbrB/MazE/SpoVT family DNA-binding domain-containing protein [Candidatus Woesearchaeota archaeon]
MRRRVIQIANSTQLVSLPISWARSLNIKKGDELEVVPEGNKLTISAEHQPEFKAISLDVTGVDRTSLLYLIRGLYRRGYDQIDLSFRDPLTIHFRTEKKEKVAAIIYTEVSRLSGMEIVRQTDSSCSVKCISEATPREFESIMRRIFLLLSDLNTEFVKAASKSDITSLENVEQKHHTISKFISYCIRLLNKHGHPEHGKITFLHHILATLDRITDFLKYGARDLLVYKKPLKPETIQVLNRGINAVNMYHKFFFEFNFDLLSKLNENRDTCKREIEKLSGKIPYPEFHVLHKMEQTLDLFLDLCESRISIAEFPQNTASKN